MAEYWAEYTGHMESRSREGLTGECGAGIGELGLLLGFFRREIHGALCLWCGPEKVLRASGEDLDVGRDAIGGSERMRIWGTSLEHLGEHEDSGNTSSR